jgi:phosphoglycolate phosphatase
MLNPDPSRQAANPAASEPPLFAGVRLVVFDLDGTLVDSIGDLAWCGNETLRRLGMPRRDPAAARDWVGNGIERFVKRVLTGEMEAEPDDELFSTAFEIFDSLYAEHVSSRSEVYPGARECLRRVTSLGIHRACVTNKAERFTGKMLSRLELDGDFELVVSGDTTPRKKPDPMPLQYAAEYFSLNCRECLMVGDSSNDIVAARSAGFHVACVPYGYNHGKPIGDSNPDIVIDNLAQLPELIGGTP